MKLLRFLESTAYDNLSRFTLGRNVIHSILRWANMLDCRPSLEVDAPYLLWFHLSDTTSQGVVTSVSKDIMKRMRHLTNKIYLEMLHKKTYFGGTKYMTIDGFDDIVFRNFPWAPRCRIVISRPFLDWMTMEGRIPFSFTNFIRTQDLATCDPFYISPDIYHTQITEYSLLTFQK